MSNSNNDDRSVLLERIEKDAKGALTTILILGIIKKEERTWGYQIKKKLKEITHSDSNIKNSSLYTILRSMENSYKLVVSEMKERRRYYSLTDLGHQEVNRAYEYWRELVRTGEIAFERLGFPKSEPKQGGW